MKDYFNRTKIMVGLDALDRIAYEVYYHNCSNALVIYDTSCELSGSKLKLKRILSKSKANLHFVHINSENIASWVNVKRCYDMLNECKADHIICLGTGAIADIGKAVKVLACCEIPSFENVQKLNFIKNDIKLIVAPISGGYHHSLMHGSFCVYDKHGNTLYKFNSQKTCPDAVTVDTRLLDKVSDTALLGMQLSALCMAILSLIDSKNINNKIYSMTAIDIISDIFTGKGKVNVKQSISSQMYAGASFLNIKKNIIDEFVCQAMLKCSSDYSLILLNIMRNHVDCIMPMLDEETIRLLGNAFGFNMTTMTKDEWCKRVSDLIKRKLDDYFSDENVPSGLSTIGLKQNDAKDIIDEVANAYQYSEVSEKIYKFRELIASSIWV